VSIPVATARGSAPVEAQAHGATSSANGLTLTIETPRSAYPPDALVPVTVTLRNRSNGSAAIEECGGFLPAVEMLDSGGHQVNQPSIPTGVTHPACFDPTGPVPLAIGDTATWQGLLILGAPRLRAAETIYRVGDLFTAPGTTLQTPILPAQALPPARTWATILTTPHLHAAVQAPAGARIFYSDRVDCADTQGAAVVGGSRGWTQAAGSTIVPTAVDGCRYITRWRIAVAVEGLAPIWLDRHIPLPPLPAGGTISAPACRSAPPRGTGAIAATWRGAVYVAAANGTLTCRLTGGIGATDAWLSPDGRWASWLAPERARPWIDDLWLGRTDGAATPERVPGANFSTPNHQFLWSPRGAMLAYRRGSTFFVARPGGGAPVALAGDGREFVLLSWLPNGSAVAAQAGPAGLWAHTLDLALESLSGHVKHALIQFPTWLNNPRSRPIGSRILPAAVAGADGSHVFLPTSGGGVRLSGIWAAPMAPAPAGNPARLVIGTRARIQGYPAPAAHLTGATHLFGSPDGRYVAVDPRTGFWVVDTRTLKGHLIPVSSSPGCAVSQSTWMSGGSVIAFVQSCRLANGPGFRSTLWSVGVNDGTPRRLLSAIDYQPDAISIGTV
jgi:hypothetical protein